MIVSNEAWLSYSTDRREMSGVPEAAGGAEGETTG